DDARALSRAGVERLGDRSLTRRSAHHGQAASGCPERCPRDSALPPWFENLGKRQVKAPKVYVRDSGLLHALLGADSATALHAHPKVGASWEGFVLDELIGLAGERNAFYWRTQAGAELDLLLFVRGRR